MNEGSGGSPERRKSLPFYVNPLIWLAATAVILFWALDIWSALSAENHPVLSAAMPFALVGTIVGSPVLYGVLLRRAGADWFGVTGRVVIVLGAYVLVGGVVVPDLFCAIDRGKQKRTLADMRAIAHGIDAYLATHPQGARASSVAELNAILGTHLPGTDTWANEFFVHWDGRHYIVRSFGKDGRQTTGRTPEDYIAGETTTLADDIVLVDGAFVRYPEGLQPTLTPPTPRP